MKKLEELFSLPPASEDDDNTGADTESEFTDNTDAIPAESVPTTANALDILEQIDASMPAVRGLEASDAEMDDLASKAVESYDDLMTLGMNVDSRYSSEIFSVASTMLGHAITAKTAKLNKKLRMIDMKMKQAKMMADLEKRAEKAGEEINAIPTAEGIVLDRNELMRRLKGDES